jgi:hypothetical protein
MLWIAACETDRVGETTAAPPDLILQSNTKRIAQGGTVIVRTSSIFTGHDANIQWSATGGELTTEQNGRIARVKFDRPGNYVISAILTVDGRVLESESTTVAVMSRDQS